MIHRKLVRPNLAEIKERFNSGRHQENGAAPTGGRGSHGSPGHGPRRRVVPAEQTNAEAFYYLKQMNNKTPMVVVLDNGDVLRGRIEWYDKICLKVHRDDGPNLLLFKHAIRYLYKQEEEEGAE